MTEIKLPPPAVITSAFDPNNRVQDYYTADQVRAAIEADRQATKELLQHPVHVHANMCRGIIAPITFDQLAHILGEEATSAWLADRKGMGALSRQQIIDRFGFLEGIVSEHNFRRIYETAIEIAAVSDRQASGEPVAWYTDDHLTDKSATTWDRTVAARWRDKGWPVGELFAAPKPPQIPAPAPLRESMSSNHRSYANGWNACRAAMLEAAPTKEKP